MAEQALSGAVLAFDKTQFDIVDIHNVPWLRGYQVGSALEYSDPGAAVAKIYDRNSDEFTDEMTQVLDLQTAGGMQPVRIFSPRGCYLLGMLARTDKAKAFRAWVLDVLEGRVIPMQAKPATLSQQIALSSQRLKLLDRLDAETHPEKRRAIHGQLAWASRMMGLPVPELAKIGRDIDPDEAPWLPVMEQFARELAAGRFDAPHRFETYEGEPALCVRISDITNHLASCRELRDFWKGLQVKSDRVLKKMLERDGVIDAEVERTIAGRRISRMSVLCIAALARHGVEVGHE